MRKNKPEDHDTNSAGYIGRFIIRSFTKITICLFQYTREQLIAHEKWENRVAFDLNVFASSIDKCKLDVDDMSIDYQRTEIIEGELATFGLIPVDAPFEFVNEAINEWKETKYRYNQIVDIWQNGNDGYIRFYVIGNPLVKQF